MNGIISLCFANINFTCPYCGKTGDNSNIKRWHFDNCKFKN